MGKASRTKRERRETESKSALTPNAASAGAATAGQRSLPVFWIAIAGLVLAGIVALLVTAPNQEEAAQDKAAAKVPTYADVAVSGEELTSWDGTGSDPGIGERVPELRGEKFDGFKATLATDEGVARAYVVLAHWCPHCQDEVPRIVDWAKDHELPEGVEIVAVSTAVDEGQPNFPPAKWLAREQWPYDVLIDDEVGTAQAALGVEGFPYLVFMGKDGTVVERFSGEMPIKDFDAAIRRLGETEPTSAEAP